MEKNVRAHVVISGRVQGVFFRVETSRKATEIGITGWVRNRPDGTVEAVFEGDDGSVTRMLEWCRSGPPTARVQDVATVWEEYSGAFTGFVITR